MISPEWIYIFNVISKSFRSRSYDSVQCRRTRCTVYSKHHFLRSYLYLVTNRDTNILGYKINSDTELYRSIPWVLTVITALKLKLNQLNCQEINNNSHIKIPTFQLIFFSLWKLRPQKCYFKIFQLGGFLRKRKYRFMGHL